MKKSSIYSVVVTAILSSAIVSCSSGSNGAGISGQADQLPSTPWQFRLTSECADQSPKDCVAGYGFTVLGNGTYQVGPAPDAVAQTGRLADDEYAQLQELAGKVEAASASGGDRHHQAASSEPS